MFIQHSSNTFERTLLCYADYHEDLLICSFVLSPAISICDRTPKNITAKLQNANLFRLRNNQ
jgi:hypothetical protein